MKTLCFVATVPAVVHSFLREHIHASTARWSVKVVSNPDGAELLNGIKAEFIPLAIERKISLWKDFLALVRLVVLFHHKRFDLVHSIMPKTGLLAMLAAWLTGTPIRIHTFTGQVWANKHGWKRDVLKMFDQLIVFFATHILVDSPSQRDFLVSEGVLSLGKAKVIGVGSVCGVDATRFHPDLEAGWGIRRDLGIAQDAKVILFLGRLNHDKGILDLATAFVEIARCDARLVLLLVGAEEDVPFIRIQEICCAQSNRLHYVSFTSTPERYMAAADIFCLPSYREGFGLTIIEAAACSLPTVASRIYGITDAVEDGKTGLLFRAGDIIELTQTLLKLIVNHELRQKMGEAARVRALEFFSSQRITNEMVELYDELLDQQ